MTPAPKKRRPAPRRETVSGQLRAIIKARRMTPYAVAQAAGVAPSVLTRFVNNDRQMTTDTLDAVCSALGLELKETRRGRSAATPRAEAEPSPSS
jgi:transcriptional regulator with XRE-family HTH domain